MNRLYPHAARPALGCLVMLVAIAMHGLAHADDHGPAHAPEIGHNIPAGTDAG